MTVHQFLCILQVTDMHGDFCQVFTASAKWKVELRAKIGLYSNRCFAKKNFEFP